MRRDPEFQGKTSGLFFIRFRKIIGLNTNEKISFTDIIPGSMPFGECSG
jgi:hypothetical protein